MEKVTRRARPIGWFWKRYRQRSIILIVTVQFLSTVLIAGVLFFTGFVSPSDIWSWTAISGIFVILLISQFLLFLLVSEPFRQLLASLTHSSGEPTITTPPNPNDKSLTGSGLGPVVQYIYELTSHDDKPAVKPNAVGAELGEVFDHTSSAVTILDEDKRIVFASKSAPVVDATEGRK